MGRRIVEPMRRRGLALVVLAALAFPAISTSGVSTNPLVGTWTRTTTCAELLQALSRPGLKKLASEMVVGNQFIPGVRSVAQLKDPSRPCLGAVPRKHSHFFTKDGKFGSLDWNREEVDDGSYTVSTNTVTVSKEFPRVTFLFRVVGNKLSLVPQIPKGCSTFRCAWAVSVAYPGKSWVRERR